MVRFSFQKEKERNFFFSFYIHSFILGWKSYTLIQVLTSTKWNECREYLQTSERYIEADVQRGGSKYPRIWIEGQAYSQFVKYMREVASKAIIESSIMTFCFLVLTSNANNKYFMDYLIIFPVFKDNV